MKTDIPAFTFARTPNIIFGPGEISRLPELIHTYGKTVLLVTGAHHLQQSTHWNELLTALDRLNIHTTTVSISSEPSPQLIDDTVTRLKDDYIDVVVGIGGGSVIDAAKAIAGLLQIEHSVMDFLEGVGPELPYPGPSTPFIAIPTTAGTGSEATKNAVLGTKEYKKSFRDDSLVPDYAIIDPDLLKSCPATQIAANGMDALTQLMESYVSTRSNPMTESLAKSGLRMVRESLLPWYTQGEDASSSAREGMAYAALQSGICLAETGLGSVHGLAAPLGAFFPIPHGVVCGILVARCTQMNIETMIEREPDNPALKKYVTVSTVLANKKHASKEASLTALMDTLYEWTQKMLLPRLGNYGVTESEFDKIIANGRGNSMKTNPITLTDDDIHQILADCL